MWLLSHSLRSLFQGTVREPVTYYQKIEIKNNPWGKAFATVDVSAARVAAWLMSFMSYERIREHVSKNGDLLRRQINLPDQRGAVFLAVQKFPGALENRFFAIWWSWKREEDGSFVLAFADVDEFLSAASSDDGITQLMAEQQRRRERDGTEEDSQTLVRDNKGVVLLSLRQDARKKQVAELNNVITKDPVAAKAVRASTRGFWQIKLLASGVCSITVVLQGNLGGSIPQFVVEMRVKRALNLAGRIQDKFARNGKLVDKEMRGVFASPPPLAELNEEQMSVVEDCRSLESEDGSEWETLASPSPFVSMWMKHAPAKENERSIAIGKATAVIDCPGHEAVGESSEANASGAARRTFRTSDRRHCVRRRLGWSEPPTLKHAFGHGVLTSAARVALRSAFHSLRSFRAQTASQNDVANAQIYSAFSTHCTPLSTCPHTFMFIRLTFFARLQRICLPL